MEGGGEGLGVRYGQQSDLFDSDQAHRDLAGSSSAQKADTASSMACVSKPLSEESPGEFSMSEHPTTLCSDQFIYSQDLVQHVGGEEVGSMERTFLDAASTYDGHYNDPDGLGDEAGDYGEMVSIGEGYEHEIRAAMELSSETVGDFVISLTGF